MSVPTTNLEELIVDVRESEEPDPSLVERVRSTWNNVASKFGRGKVVAAVSIFALAVILFGILAAGLIKSPATVAAEAAPPPASTLTEPATLRQISRTVLSSGTVGPAVVYEARAGASKEDTLNVFTSVKVKRGDSVRAGERIVEIGGRPVIVLPGRVPTYRDMVPGSTGRDVRQLQLALTKLKYFSGPADGTFDAATKSAVAAMYEDLGYAAPRIGEDSLENVNQEVVSAQRSLSEAEASLRVASRVPGNGAEKASLRRAVTYAREDLARARSALIKAQSISGAMLPSSEFLFVPTLPATVLEVPAQVGAQASGVAVRLSSGPLVVRGALNPSENSLVEPGQSAELIVGGQRVPGVVERLEQAAPTEGAVSGSGSANGSAAANQPSVVISPNTRLPSALLGQNVRVVITTESTPSPVLAVPIAAIQTTPSGESVVKVVTPNDGVQEVSIRTGFLGDGYVEVVPTAGGLSQGDSVVVSTGSEPRTEDSP